MTDDLVKRWDEYVESMGSVMGEVEHMAQQMRDRIVELTAKNNSLDPDRLREDRDEQRRLDQEYGKRRDVPDRIDVLLSIWGDMSMNSRGEPLNGGKGDKHITYIREDAALVLIDAAVSAAFERAAVIAFDLEDESHPRPWENWGEHRNMVTAQTVAKEISEALYAEAAAIRNRNKT